jgi:hypothetical protein
MDLLKTSRLINKRYDNLDEEVKSKIPYCEYILKEYENTFEFYAKNYKNEKQGLLFVDVLQVNVFLNNFDKMESYKTFKKPHLIEYFNRSLNFMVIIDFLVNFNKFDNSTIVDDKYTQQKIFEFFVILNQFYHFSIYLQLDEDFLEYLQTLIVLYSLSLNRSILEIHFNNTLPLINHFFYYNLFIPLYKENNYKCYKDKERLYNYLIKTFENDLVEFDPEHDYQTDTYAHVDKLFKILNCYSKDVERKIKEKESKNEDSDNDNENESDSEDSMLEPEYSIEETDPNYKLYRQQFIYREFQKAMKYYSIVNDIEKIDVEIKKYTALKNNKDDDFSQRILTMMGEELEDYNNIYQQQLEKIFQIAYNFGHQNIVQRVTNVPYFVITQTIYDIINDAKQLPDSITILTKNINKFLIKKYSNNSEFVKFIQSPKPNLNNFANMVKNKIIEVINSDEHNND